MTKTHFGKRYFHDKETFWQKRERHFWTKDIFISKVKLIAGCTCKVLITLSSLHLVEY